MHVCQGLYNMLNAYIRCYMNIHKPRRENFCDQQWHWKGRHCGRGWAGGAHVLCIQGCSSGSLWMMHGSRKPCLVKKTATPTFKTRIYLREPSWSHLPGFDTISGFPLALTPRGLFQGQGNLVNTIIDNPEQVAVWLLWRMQNFQLRKYVTDLKIFRYLKCQDPQRDLLKETSNEATLGYQSSEEE